MGRANLQCRRGPSESSESVLDAATSRLLRINARDLVGYSVPQMFIHVPLVFFLCWLFAHYIPFVPPMK